MRLEPAEVIPTSGPRHLRVEPWRGNVAGAVAAAVALGLAELVASLGSSLPSLVTGVGGWLIDRSPGSLSRAVISMLGTNNKPALVIGIVTVSLLLGAWFGRRSVNAPLTGVAAFVAFGALGAVASAGEVGATIAGAFVVAVVAAGVGIVTLLGLLAIADGKMPVTTAQIESPTDPWASRRSFIGFAGAATAFAGLAATGGRALAGQSQAELARSRITLPEPASGAAPPTTTATQPASLDDLSPLYTPNDDFFRIDTALTIPQVDPEGWNLTIDGLVDEPLSFSFDDLQGMPLVESVVTLSCVSNTVGGDLVGNARWLGVPLLDLLDQAGLDPEVSQVVGHSVDGFTAGFPLAAIQDGRPALVAIGMNGEPLPLRHGFPARLVVSGLYGYVSATKWLERIQLTTWEDFDGYWIPRGWSKEGPVHTQSRIDVPRNSASLPAGETPIAGVAWAPSRGIDRVEVQVDDGEWIPTELSESIGEHAWRQWTLMWDATPGRHSIRVRATDGSGEIQTVEERPPAPSGATGRHEVQVEVS